MNTLLNALESLLATEDSIGCDDNLTVIDKTRLTDVITIVLGMPGGDESIRTRLQHYVDHYLATESGEE